MRLLRWLVARLGRPWAGHVVIAIGLVLAAPSLLSPFFIDEQVQGTKWKQSLEHSGQPARTSILNDYFVFSNETLNKEEMEHGLGAWWTAPDFKVAFWRPLSAATHVVDQILWPKSAVMMHVHGLCWLLALLFAFNALLRRFLAPATATLALALYAWDDARGMLLSWIANRSPLIAGVFGMCAIIAYDKWRRDGWRAGAWLAPLLLGTGLFCGEMAVATCGFLLGHALFLDKGTILARLLRLAPYAGVVVVWQVIYAVGGYGVSASGGYINPLQEPLSFVVALAERVPVLSMAQLTPIAGDFWAMYPPVAKVVVFLLALVTLVVVGRVLWPRLAAQPQARFWLAGAAVSLMLICATGPQDRNLVFVGFGVAPVLAIAFASMVERAPVARWSRVVVGSLVVFNLILAPLLLPAKCLTILGIVKVFSPVDESIPHDASIAERTLVVPWTGLEPAIYFSYTRRDLEGIARPGRTRILSSSLGDVSVTRVDDVTLRLRPTDGFFASPSSQIFRSESRPFRLGDVVQLSNMRATVREVTDGGRPMTVEFRFSEPLESSQWLWMRGTKQGGLVAWVPPKVGETSVISVSM